MVKGLVTATGAVAVAGATGSVMTLTSAGNGSLAVTTVDVIRPAVVAVVIADVVTEIASLAGVSGDSGDCCKPGAALTLCSGGASRSVASANKSEMIAPARRIGCRHCFTWWS